VILGMDGIATFLVQQPLHILGVGIALFLAWMAIRPRRSSMLTVALAWLGYAGWEWLVQVRSPDADIRVDRLLLWLTFSLKDAHAMRHSSGRESTPLGKRKKSTACREAERVPSEHAAGPAAPIFTLDSVLANRLSTRPSAVARRRGVTRYPA
jgi:hypothetical protein